MSNPALTENVPDVSLSVVHINCGNTPRDCLFDAWRESTRPLFGVIAVNGYTNYRVDVTAYRVDELIVDHTCYDATVYTRSNKHVIHGDTDYFALHFLKSGAERIVTEHGAFRMAPDRICLRDWRYSFVGTAERTAQIGIVIPRHLLPVHDNVSRQPPDLCWSLASPAGRMLAMAIMQLWKILPTTTQWQTPGLAANFISLLNGLLVNTLFPQSEALRLNNAMRLTIKEYIRTHLERPDLDVDLLCGVFHLSRTSLYRLFQEDGGVQTNIREQRLKRCLEALRYQARQQNKVREVAEQWGFFSASHFHRLFKKQYGLAPSKVLDPQDRKMVNSISVRSSQHLQRPQELRQWLEGKPVA